MIEISATIEFTCPVTQKLTRAMSEDVAIEGFCANDEYSAAHFLVLRCPSCHEEHKLKI